jgi:FeS assembly SUF system regulator
MLRITKEADYGIMLLAVMAEHPPGEIHAAREVAERSGLPLPMVSKIMRALARGGVLTSHRGVSGGYSLDRPAASTSVAEVIRAIEGPISMVQCGAEPGACDQEPDCPTRVNWARISREVEHALERMPISEMLAAPHAEQLLKVVDEGSTSLGETS